MLASGGVPAPNSAAELTLASWKLVSDGMKDLDLEFEWIDREAGSFRTKMAGMQEITGVFWPFHIPRLPT